MGIENRDYVRDDNRSRPGTGALGGDYPAVRTIIIITVAVYLAQIFITRPVTNEDIRQMYPELEKSRGNAAAFFSPWQEKSTNQTGGETTVGEAHGNTPNGDHQALIEQIIGNGRQKIDASAEKELEYYIQQMFPKTSVPEKWLQLDTNQVLKKGQVWRLLTSAFCHDRVGVWHILINMVLLFWFGRELETIYGTRAFAWFYVTAAIFSALAYIGIQLATGERVPAIGASGAVMAVMMVYSIFHPRDEIYLFFVIPIQIRFLLMFYVVYDLHPVLLQLAGTPRSTGIAHSAHLGGLLYGYLFWKSGISLLSLWDRTSTARSRVGRLGKSGSAKSKNTGEPRILPLRGPFANSGSQNSGSQKARDNLDQQVDRILAKISESGRDSLTDDEVKILEQASRKYSERPGS